MFMAHPIAFRRHRPVGEDDEVEESVAEGDKPEYAVAVPDGAGQLTPCEDDETWRDPYGDSCKVYRNTIKEWGRDKACKEHWSGLAMKHCRASCGSCKKGEPLPDYSPACVDNACISPWQKRDGRCSSCVDFPKGCTDPRYKSFFVNECPVTCGTCKPPNVTVAPVSEEQKQPEIKCEDSDKKWCTELGSSYCSEDVFSKKCPQTCELCAPKGAKSMGCADKFSSYTCSRYASYGWCDRKDTKDAVRLQCKMTCGQCNLFYIPGINGSDIFKKRSGSKRSAYTSEVTILALVFFTIARHLF